MKVSSYRVEPITCPRCLTRMDGLTHIGGSMALPDPGDFTICAYCGTMLVYADDLSVREATGDEQVQAAMDPRIAVARAWVDLMRESRP